MLHIIELSEFISELKENEKSLLSHALQEMLLEPKNKTSCFVHLKINILDTSLNEWLLSEAGQTGYDFLPDLDCEQWQNVCIEYPIEYWFIQNVLDNAYCGNSSEAEDYLLELLKLASKGDVLNILESCLHDGYLELITEFDDSCSVGYENDHATIYEYFLCTAIYCIGKGV